MPSVSAATSLTSIKSVLRQRLLKRLPHTLVFTRSRLADFLTSDNVIASKAETMVETIAHIERVYGTAKGYAKAVGLTDEEIASIRTLFMKQVSRRHAPPESVLVAISATAPFSVIDRLSCHSLPL